MPLFLQFKLFKRGIYKNLEHLFSGILTYVYFYSQCRSRTFLGWMENMFLHTPNVRATDIYGVYVILIL
jgi:hypothetical protein